MRRTLLLFLALLLCLTMMGCHPEEHVQIATTTAPVYEFTSRLCAGTQISVGLIISESVSCLHDYTLQTGQMRMLESAQLLILSGAGLEEFLSDTIPADKTVIDASATIHLLCPETEHDHEHEDHHHEQDPHIWLNPANAAIMAKNICAGLQTQYPDHSEQFEKNLTILLEELDALDQYGKKQPVNNLSYDLALAVQGVTGYEPISYDGTTGAGYKDWAMDALGIPSLTLEIGCYNTPLVQRDIYNTFARCEELLKAINTWLYKSGN